MPLLTYSYPPFVPNTIISSTKVNAKFTDISTLLNTTGLDDTNLQNAGITRATKLKLGTANYVIINDGTGAMSEEAHLATSRGGTGLTAAPTGADQGKVLLVDGTGAFILSASTNGPASNMYNSFRFS